MTPPISLFWNVRLLRAATAALELISVFIAALRCIFGHGSVRPQEKFGKACYSTAWQCKIHESRTFAERSTFARMLWEHVLARHINSVPSVLDLGCGSGVLESAILAASKPASVTAVDISPEMLRLARARFDPSIHHISIELINSDVTDYIEHCTVTYDVIVFSACLRFLDDPLSNLQSATDLLSSNGVIVLRGINNTLLNRIRALAWGIAALKLRAGFFELSEHLDMYLDRVGLRVCERIPCVTNVNTAYLIISQPNNCRRL